VRLDFVGVENLRDTLEVNQRLRGRVHRGSFTESSQSPVSSFPSPGDRQLATG
jgi:hypothetical protein